MELLLLCTICAICAVSPAKCQTIGQPMVRTRNGQVQGKLVTVEGQTYPVYMSIPYAEPPIGRLRFQNPVPVHPWAPRIFPANGTFSKRCVQATEDPNTISEDCLYLNVFTPSNQPNQNTFGSGQYQQQYQSGFRGLPFQQNQNGFRGVPYQQFQNGGMNGYPVMFWIHGGAFISGAASEYQVEGILKNLVSRGVVVVSINYRLGPFGFWTSKTAAAPGNFGFWDQTIALQWTRNNIGSFGGDPNRITIFGESAGAVSVSILTLSPVSQNLFQQAIMQSGSGLLVWAVKPDVVGDESDQLASILGCSSFSQTNYGNNGIFGNFALRGSRNFNLQCMQSKSVQEIVTAEQSIKQLIPVIPWTGRVDGRFLPDTPKRLAQRRPKINVITGCTRDEWGLFEFIPDENGRLSPVSSARELNDSIPAFLPNSLFVNAARVQYLVRNSFIDSVQLQPPSYGADSFWLNQSVQMKSGEMFWVGTYADAVSYADRYPGSVYLYSLDYLSPNIMKGQNWRGVLHATDLFYVFNSGLPLRSETELTVFGNLLSPIPESSQDRNIAELIHTFWTNFAKYGNPTPRSMSSSFFWEPFRSTLSNYASIDSPPSMKRGFHSGITHKLDEQSVKHEKNEVSEFSMECNPNVQLSSACGCALERATSCT